MLNKIMEVRRALDAPFNVVGYEKKQDFFTLLSKCEEIAKEGKIELLSKEDINAMIMFLEIFREYCVFNANSRDTLNMMNTSMEIFSEINSMVKKSPEANIIDNKIEEVMRIMNCFLTLNESASILRKLLRKAEIASQYNPPSLELSHHYISTVLDGVCNEK